MTYPISDVTRRVVYSGSAGAGPYTFTFEVLTQGDIGVYKNSTLLTLTTDYTVTINADGTGYITLVSAATAADTIAIFGNKGIQRSTDFVTGGDLFANSLNDELDAQTIFAQQNAEAIVRSIRAPQFDPTGLDMTLDEASVRANKLLGFANDGSVTSPSTTMAQLDAAVSSFVNATGNNAASILYDPDGTGAVQTTVQGKLREFVSLEDFGAVGDGVTDDTTALDNAIAAQVPLYFGDKTYKITSPIAQTLTKDVIWYGRGGKISYENPSHSEYAIRLSDTTGVDIVINNLTIDGTKQANKVLEILNNTSNSTPTNFVANELRVENAKRLNTFSGGAGIYIRGAFEDVTFNGGWVKDCELPTGQGTPAVIGIGGISITWYSDTSYVKRVTLNGILIEKIYSSDLSYNFDQDGIKYFGPNISGGTSGKEESNLVVMGGCRFVNCYGRSIKTQCRNTVVRDSHFERTEGLASGVGNGEISSQYGTCVVDSCTFSYSNGQIPGGVVGPSSTTGWKSGATISNNEVYLESGTVLDKFVQTFPSAVVDPWSRIEVFGNKILGEVKRFVSFLTNAEKAHLTVRDNWVEEIGLSVTSERALVYVQASGGTSPRYAYVNLVNNVYAGSQTVYLGRDSVTGTSMDANWSGYGNFGFVNDFNGDINDADPLTNIAIPAKITGYEDSRYKGYFGMQTKRISSGATATFDVGNRSVVIVNVEYNHDSYAIFGIAGTTGSIAVGSEVALGTTTNPGTGRFNVWLSSPGAQISVENTDANARAVSVWVFATI